MSCSRCGSVVGAGRDHKSRIDLARHAVSEGSKGVYGAGLGATTLRQLAQAIAAGDYSCRTMDPSVLAFQNAWVALYPGHPVETNGFYGQLTAAAVSAVLGSAPPGCARGSLQPPSPPPGRTLHLRPYPGGGVHVTPPRGHLPGVRGHVGVGAASTSGGGSGGWLLAGGVFAAIVAGSYFFFDSAGRPRLAPPTRGPAPAPRDQSIGKSVVKTSGRAEALSWIQDNPNRHPFAGNTFDGRDAAANFVKRLYSIGAKKVVVAGISGEAWRIAEEGGPYADTLFVTLGVNPRQTAEFILGSPMRPDEFSVVSTGTDRGRVRKRIDENTPVRAGNTLRLWWD